MGRQGLGPNGQNGSWLSPEEQERYRRQASTLDQTGARAPAGGLDSSSDQASEGLGAREASEDAVARACANFEGDPDALSAFLDNQARLRNIRLRGEQGFGWQEKGALGSSSAGGSLGDAGGQTTGALGASARSTLGGSRGQQDSSAREAEKMGKGRVDSNGVANHILIGHGLDIGDVLL